MDIFTTLKHIHHYKLNIATPEEFLGADGVYKYISFVRDKHESVNHQAVAKIQKEEFEREIHRLKIALAGAEVERKDAERRFEKERSEKNKLRRKYDDQDNKYFKVHKVLQDGFIECNFEYNNESFRMYIKISPDVFEAGYEEAYNKVMNMNRKKRVFSVVKNQFISYYTNLGYKVMTK